MGMPRNSMSISLHGNSSDKSREGELSLPIVLLEESLEIGD